MKILKLFVRLLNVISYSSKNLLLNAKLKNNYIKSLKKLNINNFKLKNYDKNSIYAFLDLNNVITFDLISWLLWLKATSKNKRVYLIILPKTGNEILTDISKEKGFIGATSMQYRFFSILLPLLDLVEDFKVNKIFFKERSEAIDYLNLPSKFKYPPSAETIKKIDFMGKYTELTNFYNINKYIPSLKSPDCYSDLIDLFFKNKNISKKKVITITLRQCSYSIERNSIIANWIQIYEWLKIKNYQPVFINDLENLDIFSKNKIEKEYLTFDLASLDCRARLAIYEKSFFNIGVDSGAASLMYYSKYSKFLLFKFYFKHLNNCNDEYYLKNFNMKHGDQHNHFTIFQKIVWKTDSVKIIKEEFLKMEKLLDER